MRRCLRCQNADIGGASGALDPRAQEDEVGIRGPLRTQCGGGQVRSSVGDDRRFGASEAGELFGAIDSTGKEVIPVRYTSLLDVQDGYLVAGEAIGLGLLDKQGKVMVAPLYDEVRMATK